MKPKTYFIRTFGCQANKADSEKIAGYLEAVGLKPAKKVEESDWVIINTCSVRQSAEDRVFGLVKNLQKLKIENCPPAGEAGKLKIILSGCILYHPIADLRKKLSRVDYFVKISEWPEFLSQLLNYSITQLLGVDPRRVDEVHTWVPIMEGCSHYCAYCVVPYARGPERSRPFEEIVCEVKELAKRGYRKITLLGQNVNSYEPSFAKLLRRLHEIEGIKEISFITSNPWGLTDDIIEAMKLPKIDRYLHLPIQSGDNGILKKMNRPYTAAQYVKLVEKIRRKIPDIKIGTDIIVGFPGETKQAFENTVKLCEEVGFEKAYIAMYSPRPGTAAYRLKDDVSHKEKKRRWQILEKLINCG